MTPTEDLSLAEHPFRGLIRTAYSLLAVFIVTGICWSIWNHLASKRLRLRIDDIKARHEPFLATDFPNPVVADSQNAAVLWQAVVGALPADNKAPTNSNLEFHNYPPYPPEWFALEEQSIAVSAKMFALADRAAAADVAVWDPARRSIYRANYSFRPVSDVAGVLADSMVYASLRGDSPLAIRRASELLKLSRCTDAMGPLVEHLVAVGMNAMAAGRVMSIAPDLSVEPQRSNGVAASQADVRGLIDLLQNENRHDSGEALAIDCVRTDDEANFLAVRTSYPLLKPMIDLSESRTLDLRRIDRTAATAPDAVAAAAAYALYPADARKGLSTRPGQVDQFSWALPLDRSVDLSWRAIAECRLAAVSLAIRLYQADHHRLPTTLIELVPDYLPAIPVDPFSANHSPIGYIIRKQALPDGNDRPLLFINVNGDPATAPLPPEPSYGWRPGTTQWCDLSRWHPAPVRGLSR